MCVFEWLNIDDWIHWSNIPNRHGSMNSSRSCLLKKPQCFPLMNAWLSSEALLDLRDEDSRNGSLPGFCCASSASSQRHEIGPFDPIPVVRILYHSQSGSRRSSKMYPSPELSGNFIFLIPLLLFQKDLLTL